MAGYGVGGALRWSIHCDFQVWFHRGVRSSVQDWYMALGASGGVSKIIAIVSALSDILFRVFSLVVNVPNSLRFSHMSLLGAAFRIGKSYGRLGATNTTKSDYLTDALHRLDTQPPRKSSARTLCAITRTEATTSRHLGHGHVDNHQASLHGTSCSHMRWFSLDLDVMLWHTRPSAYSIFLRSSLSRFSSS
jgi:hypothetical protein